MDTHAILKTVAHRPFPLPRGPWIMTQIWHELLFAHWSLAPEILRPLVPSMLELDTFEGQSWLSLTPFRMTHVRPRGFPPLPCLSQFPEMNLRTYVLVKGIPGIYFFSLDAGNVLAVVLANRLFYLPYFHARMRSIRVGESIEYASKRLQSKGPQAQFVGRYRPISPVTHAQRGTLDYWLAERYRLYTVGSDHQVYCADIHHGPWSLQRAELTIACNSMGLTQGIHLPEQPSLLRYAQRQEVLVWPLRRV
jgi:uncharacterized protein